MRNELHIGDVHYVGLNESNGVTPKDGYSTRNKFFIILGFDNRGNAIGGVVINSKVNNKFSCFFTDYLMPISIEQCPCLSHNSFVNCTTLKTAPIELLTRRTYRCSITTELVDMIKGTLIESPTANRKLLKDFGLI